MISVKYLVVFTLIFAAQHASRAMERTENAAGKEEAEKLKVVRERAQTMGDVPTLCRLMSVYLPNDLPQALALGKKAFKTNAERAMRECKVIELRLKEHAPERVCIFLRLVDVCKHEDAIKPANGNINTKNALVEESENLNRLMDLLNAEEQERVAELVTQKFLACITNDPETLIIPFLKWCLYLKAPAPVMSRCCAHLSGCRFLLSPLSRRLFGLLKKCALDSAECGHELAVLLVRCMEDKEPACSLWRTINHPLAPWGIIAYGAKLQEKEQFCQMLKLATEKFSSLKQPIPPEAKELIVRALIQAEKTAQTAAEYLLLGQFYKENTQDSKQGNSQELKDEKKSELFCKKAYERMIADKLVPGASWNGAWEFFIDRLASDEEVNAKNREMGEAALMAILEDRVVRQMDLQAAILLVKCYAYGRNGRLLDSSKLDRALSKISPILDTPESLKTLFNETKILELLNKQQHVQAHKVIIMMNLSLAVSENKFARENERADLCCRALRILMESKKKDEILLDNQLINHVFKCAGIMLTVNLCSLLTFPLCQEYQREISKQDVDLKKISAFAKKIELAFYVFNKLLFDRIEKLANPFFQDNDSEVLKNTLEELLNQSLVEKNLCSQQIQNAMRRCHALLTLLANKGYCSDDFVKGIELLAMNVTPDNRTNLSKILAKIENYLSTGELEKPKQMRMLYVKARLLHHLNAPFDTLICLGNTVRLARSISPQAYFAYCKERNILKDFNYELDECKIRESEMRNMPFWASYFLTAHYSALAEVVQGEIKRDYDTKVQCEKEKMIQVNSFLAHCILGSEYVVNGILKADKNQAFSHFEKAFNTTHSWKDLSQILREKSEVLVEAAQKVLREYTSEEWTGCSIKLSQLWKDFSGN